MTKTEPITCHSLNHMHEKQKQANCKLCSKCKIFADFAGARARKVEAKVGSIAITMEGIVFQKYPAICIPQACQGVDTGHAYKTAISTKVFSHGSTSACGKIGLRVRE